MREFALNKIRSINIFKFLFIIILFVLTCLLLDTYNTNRELTKKLMSLTGVKAIKTLRTMREQRMLH